MTLPLYAVIHQYPFSSEAQRMTVIVQTSNSLSLYVKGAPEKIVSLCDPSTGMFIVDCQFIKIVSSIVEPYVLLNVCRLNHFLICKKDLWC